MRSPTRKALAPQAAAPESDFTNTQTDAEYFSDISAAGFPRRAHGVRWRKFLSYYRPHLGLLAADLACALIVSATALALPLCANYIVKHLALHQAEILDQIYTMGAIMLAMVGAQAISTMFVDYQGHVMGAKMESAMRKELFGHYQRLSFGFYDQQRVGQLMTRISNDLLSLAELYHHGPEDLAIAVLKFSGALFILFRLDTRMTLYIVALLPFATAYAIHFTRRMNRAIKQSKERIASINERVEDQFSGIRVVKSFANEAIEIRRFAEEHDRFLRTRRFGYKSEALFSVGLVTLAQLITVGVIVIGASRIVSASLNVADLLTYLLCVAILLDPIQRLVNFLRLWQEGLTGFHRFMDVLEVEPDIKDRAQARDLTAVRGRIALRSVSFRYQHNPKFVLRNVSLEVEPGEFVALIGYSGVGKTTLCSLLPRFYDATKGEVLIDGEDVKDICLDSLRRSIGIVQQDVYLFAGTVAENLRYGRPDADHEQIVA